MPIPRGSTQPRRSTMKDVDDPMTYTANVSVSSGFSDRQKNLFSVLQSAEKERNEKYGSKPPDPKSVDHCRNLNSEAIRSKLHVRQFVGQESIFKKPSFRPPKNHLRRSVPDYQLNPQKWTKYSLADVPQSQMTDQCNTATAFSFLKELEDRKKKESMQETIDLDNTKILFKKTSNDEGCSSSSSSKLPVSFNKSKVVMPEYVVGQKKSTKTKRKIVGETSKSESTQKAIKLDHLLEEEDE
nr:PREDICTED: protein TSSC4 [Bemisia tabaci]